jgi:plastocyanin
MAARRRTGLAALAIALALMTVTSGAADAVTVGVRGLFNGSRYVWSPTVKSIGRGVIVRWRSVEGNHTVKSRGTNWSYFRNIPIGTSVTRTFNRRGTFR